MKLVIVGASHAGLACALEARKRYPQAQIILVDREVDLGHAPDAFMQGLLSSDQQQAKTQLWVEAQSADLTWYLGWDLVDLLPDQQVITICQDQVTEVLAYDRLVLALGANQSTRLAQAECLNRVLTVKTLSQTQASWERLAQAKEVIVVGAGQLGLECLAAFSQLPLTCRLLEAQSHPLAKHLDEDLGQLLLEDLRSAGLTVHVGETVNEVRLNAQGDKIEVTSLKATYEADAVFLATNFEPNSQLLTAFDQQVDGSLVVDAYLRTSQPNVFAVGDLIQLPVAYFEHAYMPMVSHAILTGRLAAANLLTPQFELEQGQRLVKSHLLGRDWLSVGMTYREASLWEEVQEAQVDQGWARLKLLATGQQGRLLGAQAHGQELPVSLEQALSLAIKQGLTVSSLLQESWLNQLDQAPWENLLLETLSELSRQLTRKEEENAT